MGFNSGFKGLIYVIFDMIYLLTAIGLSPGGSTHLHTNNTWNNTNNNRTTQITTNVEERGPCPVFASFTLAFALQLRKKHGKTSVRLRKTSVRVKHLSQSMVLQWQAASLFIGVESALKERPFLWTFKTGENVSWTDSGPCLTVW